MGKKEAVAHTETTALELPFQSEQEQLEADGRLIRDAS